MRLNRYLKEDQVDLAFSPALPARPEDEDPDSPPGPRQLWAEKEAILDSLVSLLEKSGNVSHRRKLLGDLLNRERKATTGLGARVALPHVRTKEVKGFAVAVAIVRADQGLGFDAVDGEPIRIFIAMAAPAYDDRFYTRLERDLAQAFARGPELVDELLAATSPGEVIRILSREMG
jgi:fructose PTS system EIIBC or EIIC component